ncbi:MAG: hypothetical protein ACRD0A_03315 [Acidimicrobiales bacterium]
MALNLPAATTGQTPNSTQPWSNSGRTCVEFAPALLTDGDEHAFAGADEDAGRVGDVP